MAQATVHVRGTAEEQVEADYGRITLSASAVDQDASQAQRRADAIADVLRDALAATGELRLLQLSRITVAPETEWNPKTQASVTTGWRASIRGACEAEPHLVADVVEATISAGGAVEYTEWRLDADNPVHRRVRSAAVAQARVAAEDFAAAAGRALGDLIALADPGLLGGPSGAVMMRAASAEAMGLTLDAEQVTVSCTVEASYALA